jgi:hypothetical protein
VWRHTQKKSTTKLLIILLITHRIAWCTATQKKKKKKKKKKDVLYRTSRTTVQEKDRIPRLLTDITIRLLHQLHYNTIGPSLPLKGPDLGVLDHQQAYWHSVSQHYNVNCHLKKCWGKMGEFDNSVRKLQHQEKSNML